MKCSMRIDLSYIAVCLNTDLVLMTARQMRAIVLHALGNAVDMDIVWVELKNECVLI